jgi:two-component system LytT family response regulator
VLIFESSYDDMVSLEALIRKTAPAVETHKTGNSSTALKLFSTETFDAFFISLGAGGGDGAWLATVLREIPAYRMTPLVFMTGDPVDHLALYRAHHCYGILEKPLAAPGFETCAGPLLEAVRTGAARGPVPETERRFMVAGRQGRHVLRTSDLLFAETDGHNIILHARGMTLGGIRMRLAELVRLVGDEAFLRCHRSFAVNPANAVGIRQDGSRLRVLTFGEGGLECPCSRPYFEAVDRVLAKLAPELCSPGGPPEVGTDYLQAALKCKRPKK